MADLLDAYRRLDPAKPLEGEGLNTFYVSRPDDPIRILGAQLRADDRPMRVLLAGQRGVGKTTELRRLACEVEDAGRLAFFCDVGAESSQVGNVVRTLGVQLREKFSLPDRNDSQSYHDYLKWLVQLSHQRLVRSLVLMVDGMERASDDNEVRKLMRYLEGCNCSVVLVARLSAMLGSDINTEFENWGLVLLPAFAVYAPNRRSQDAEGRKSLESVLERRIGTEVLDSSALDPILSASGGFCRELLWLAGYACLVSHQRLESVVTEEQATAAVRQLRLKYTPGLTAEDIELLSSFAKSSRDLVSKQLLDQVNDTRIVAYHGPEGLWWDVHPILWPLVGIKPGNP